MTKRNVTALALALACAAVPGPAYPQAGAKTPVACNVMTEKDAAAHAGAPLGSVNRDEIKPTAQNGQVHHTTCGFFPKGYEIRKADRPPELGVELQLYARRNREDAKSSHDSYRSMAEERAKATRGAEKVVPVPGIGEETYMLTRTLEPKPGAVYEIAYVRVLKGRVAAQVTAWKKGAPADEIAKSAAKQVAARLP